ncbi:MAG: hypothetical protein ACKVT0_13735 [Planctomycetaceae bacterium]
MSGRYFVVILIVAGAFFVLNVNGREASPTSVILNAWKAPPCTDYANEEGLVYDAYYPTYAVVCRNLPEVINSEKRATDTDSTLFLMAGPQLTDANLQESIPTSARFAAECHADARGRWVQFTPGLGTNEHVFLLIDQTGGNGCEERIRMYSQSASYNPPPPSENACQNHTFRECYTRNCVNKPCLADLDNDGFPELLVMERVEPGKSEATAKRAYRVIKHLPKKGLRVIRELSWEEFEAIPNKMPL